MRRFVRVVLLIVGALLTVVGLAAAVLAGPDSTLRTGDRELTTETAALTSAPGALGFIGPTVYVAAAAQDGRDVFVGVGHQVDVDDYLNGVARDQIEDVGFPGSFEIDRIDGAVTAAETQPATRDWWYVQASGADRQEVEFELTAEPVNLVIMAADGEPPVAVDAQFGLEIENLFVTALLVLAAGLLLLVIAIFVLRRPRRRRAARFAGPVDADETWYEERPL
jgi:hypothetical protein